MPSTLYLIDGHALAYRMYFALTAGGSSTRWQTSKGEPTAGTYGFAREIDHGVDSVKRLLPCSSVNGIPDDRSGSGLPGEE